MEFCRHLTNGLIYNNNTESFTVSPCCFYQGPRCKINPDKDLLALLDTHRKQWLLSDTKSSCKICIDAELQNLTSYRQASFDNIDGVGNNIEFLTVAVNKKCNLACASCDSNSSSFWYQENVRNNVFQFPVIHQMHRDDKQRVTTDRFVKLLAEQDLTDLKYIKFGGGEPLMSDTHRQIMSLIPFPEKVTIQYTSNFSIMPDRAVFEIWEKFKLIKWVASLDGVGSQFEFLRWPYRWNKLEVFAKNAMNFVPGNVMFGTEHTINPLNVYYFDQFEQWFNKTLGTNRYGDKSDLNVHVCTGILGLEHTPTALRAKIKQKYGANHPVCIALDQNSYSGSTKNLVKFLDSLNKQRHTNWRTIFPEVSTYFDE